MRRRLWLVAVLGVLLVVVGAAWGWRASCVNRTIAEYERNLGEFTVAQRLGRSELSKSNESAIQEIRESFTKFLLPVVSGRHVPVFDSETGSELTRIIYDVNCSYPPWEIVNNQDVKAYPGPLPPYCRAVDPSTGVPATTVPVDIGLHKDPIVHAAPSIGRLILISGQARALEMWGSGFMVSSNKFMVSCHAIAPLLDEHGAIATDYKGRVFVSFADRSSGDADPDAFKVSDAKCASGEGVDVAVVRLEPRKGVSMPQALHFGEQPVLLPHPGILLGYADLLHPFDEYTREMYEPYENNSGQTSAPEPGATASRARADIKVAMLDGLISSELCATSKSPLLDTASTTVGSSGSPVIVDDYGASNLAVVGVHSCCDGYFGSYEDTTAPKPKLSCAQITRGFYNQDIASETILEDPGICDALTADSNDPVFVVGNNGQLHRLSCKK